jgi:molecular chaperone GrpE
LSFVKDRYKRALAETENTRIRFNKLVNDAKIFGIQSFCKDLLEVADILNLALANTSTNASNDINVLTKEYKSLHQGLVMTEERMQKIFAKNGLVQIKPNEGDKFDPNVHDALFQAKLPEKAAGSVIQVMKTGYRLQERVIRAAQVGVAQ